MEWTDHQIAQYGEEGFLVVPGLLSEAEMSVLNVAAQSLLDERADDGLHREWETSGALRQVYLAHRYNEAFRNLSRHPKVLQPVRQIIGGDVYIWHSKLNVKAAFEGSAWLWHQDYGYWKLEGVEPRMVSVAVFLDHATDDNGCLLFITGSHKWEALDHEDSPAQRYINEDVLSAKGRRAEIRKMTGKPGDVLFFDCKLVHRSRRNLSPSPRKIFMIVYNDIDNKPMLPQRPDWVVAHVFDVCR